MHVNHRKTGIVGCYRRLATACRLCHEQVGDARVAVLVEELEREVAALGELVGSRGQWPLGAA